MGVVNELDNYLARMEDLQRRWHFDVDIRAHSTYLRLARPAAEDWGPLASSEGDKMPTPAAPTHSLFCNARVALTADTDQGSAYDPLLFVSGRGAAELSDYWARCPGTARGRNKDHIQRPDSEHPAGRHLRVNPEVEESRLCA